MPPFGAHFSIAGGLVNAVQSAVQLKCQTFQMFTKSAAQWAAKPLGDAEVREFREAVRAAGLVHPTAHDSYLINLAAPGDDLFAKSVAAFVTEIERAEQLGLSHLVTHPGSHVGSGEDAGLRRVVEGLNEAGRRTRGVTVRVLIETTAGQGTNLGWRFEHLARILDGVAEPERFGVCFDTCHVFAAGYPIGDATSYADTLAAFDELIGVDRIDLFHLNDSVKPLGSRVDRHAAIGRGEIGPAAFRMIVRDERFRAKPMILETPKRDADGREMDPINLRALRQFRSGSNG